MILYGMGFYGTETALCINTNLACIRSGVSNTHPMGHMQHV